MAPNTKDFESKLLELLKDAESRGLKFVDITSGNLHRMVGDYPPAKPGSHAMPSCCNAMNNIRKKLGGEVLYAPPSGRGARLVIRYRLE